MSGDTALREIAIFRHNLFKVSEPFITGQAQKLRRHRPLYLGRLRYGQAPPGAPSLALEDLRPLPWPRLVWQMLSRNPGPYEDLLAGRKPALIHAHFGIDGVYALPLARRLGIPLVTTFHGFDATLSTPALLASPAWAHYPLFRHRLAAQGDLFLCASEFVREKLLAQGFPEARTKVHYIGVDLAAIASRGGDEETQIILHVARLVAVKGTEWLIRAFARQGGNAELVIIGDGPLRWRLERLANSLGIAPRVRFLGARSHDEVLAWMRRAAFLVLPSTHTSSGRVEGLGMVLLEAAATGIPTIGTRSGGIPEAVIDGETGFLVPERDVSALADHMTLLLGDAALRRRMGDAARAMVERRFDIAHQIESLEGHYDAALG